MDCIIGNACNQGITHDDNDDDADGTVSLLCSESTAVRA